MDHFLTTVVIDDALLVVATIVGILVLLGVFSAGLLIGRRGSRPMADDLVRDAVEEAAEPPGELVDDATGTAVEPPPTADAEATVEHPPAETEAAPAEPTSEAPSAPAEPSEAPAEPAEPTEPAEAPAAPMGPMARFRARLGRSRENFGTGLLALFRKGLDDAAFEELEERLIAADVGVEAATEIVEGLRQRAREENVTDADEALGLLKEVLRLELAVADRTLHRRAEGPTTWLVTGVNGTGKTTSIGKLAARHTRDGEKVVVAAADTFRAAAIEQLTAWGERAGARVVKQAEGADPAAVAYDGWQAASSSNADLLIVDTAGRLQNKRALMDELSKVKRVLEKGADHTDEVLLVLDATTGQNGLSQAKAFMEAVDVSGVVLTKLDGTARGGIVIAIQRQLGLPVKLVGLGETIDDLADFDPDAFVEALFADVAQDVDVEQADDAT